MLSKASWMDELLCEYVDGTMDRAVRAAFEECVECDTGLARQVRYLRCTRRLLCEHRLRTPTGLRACVRRRLSRHLPFASPIRPPHTSILVGTAVAIILAAGLVAGASRHASTSVVGLSGGIRLVLEADPWSVKKVHGQPLREYLSG